MSKALCFLWAFIYRRWLWNDFTREYDTVADVIGWRTARVISKHGHVRCCTPCFWWFK